MVKNQYRCFSGFIMPSPLKRCKTLVGGEVIGCLSPRRAKCDTLHLRPILCMTPLLSSSCFIVFVREKGDILIRYKLCRSFPKSLVFLRKKLLQETWNNHTLYRSLFLGGKCMMILGFFSQDRTSQVLSSSSWIIVVFRASQYNWFKILCWSSRPNGIWGCTRLLWIINMESPTSRFGILKYGVINFLGLWN